MVRKKRKESEAQLGDPPGDAMSIDILPNEPLLLVFSSLGFPHRQAASLVCKRWRGLLLEPQFCRRLVPGQALADLLASAASGDTLICPPGMYQETLVVDTPVRLVAEDVWQQQYQQHRQQQQHDQRPAGVRVDGTAGAAAGGPTLPRPVAAHQLPPQPGVVSRPGVVVCTLRPPVVVMNSRCCFVGFEFRTSTEQSDLSICSFGPEGSVARFERCSFSGATGLRVPYSMGGRARLELEDCSLTGVGAAHRQGPAAVSLDAGQLQATRCVLSHCSLGVEVGPNALARLVGCTLAWCHTALVVDGCLAAQDCRLWGNENTGDRSTTERLRRALQQSEAQLQQGHGHVASHTPAGPPRRRDGLVSRGEARRLAALRAAQGRRRGSSGGSAAQPPLPPTPAAAAAGGPSTSSAAAAAATASGARRRSTSGGSGAAADGAAGTAAAMNPAERLAAAAAAQWGEVSAAFTAGRQLVRVVGCEVQQLQLVLRSGRPKEVRKRAKQLVRQVYGAAQDDEQRAWEVLAASDLDSEPDEDDEDFNVPDGADMEGSDDDEDVGEGEDGEGEEGGGEEGEGEQGDADAWLDDADDPDLDESGTDGEGSEGESEEGSEGGSEEGSGNEGSGSSSSGESGGGGGGAGGRRTRVARGGGGAGVAVEGSGEGAEGGGGQGAGGEEGGEGEEDEDEEWGAGEEGQGASSGSGGSGTSSSEEEADDSD